MVGRRQPARRRGYTAEEIVDALYRGLLDRPAESTGLAFQTSRLNQGVSLAEIVRGVGHSREYFETWLRGGDLPALMEEVWAGSTRRSDERPIWLIHMMKTGGTALVQGMTSIADGRFCLHQVFLDHLLAIPALVLERASLVSGHIGVEALDLLMPADVLTATVIRNPLERVLSHYSHVRRDPALTEQTVGLSLEEFVHSPRWRPYVQDFQARNLVQRIGLSEMWRRHSPRGLLDQLADVPPGWWPELPVQAVFELAPLGAATAELRQQALEQLDRIEEVGTTDDLDSLFRDLVRTWGVDTAPPLPLANAAADRVPLEEVPPSLTDAINAANAVDWELYERARARRPAASTGTQPPSDPATPAPGKASPSSLPPRRPRRGRAGWATPIGARPGLAGAALCLLVATLDAVFVQGIALLSLVVAGPCLSVLGGRWRQVAMIAALSLVLTTVLCIPDGVWGTSDQVAVMILVGVVGVLATVAGQGRGHRPALADPAG